MQENLSKHSGIGTALKRRPDVKDGRHTWMEVYLATSQGFDTLLAHAVEQAELGALIDGARHTEYFLDVPPCA